MGFVRLLDGIEKLLVPYQTLQGIFIPMDFHSRKFVTRQIISKQRTFLSLLLIAFVFFSVASAQKQTVPSPESVLGFRPTEEKTIADWKQITDYFAKLDVASDRVAVRNIGPSTLGRPMIAAFISDAENIRNLDKYRKISAKLADPRTISGNAELESLIAEGKTVVSISCSIHANEIVASQMSMNLAHELATATDADTKEILKNTILILIPSSNPDGVDLIADWYRKTLGTKSEGTIPPELYHHYAGHDNNRDWFMLNLQETRNITQLYWREWFPQIVYDVHQMGQGTARFVIPPFFDPPNPRLDPLILREVGVIGYKMAADLQAKGVKGVATNTMFDTWWHGGFRSTPYYHNSIGILSEAASADLMTPITITKERLKAERPNRGLNSPLEVSTSHPDPWEGGKWGPKEIAEIEMTASRTVLELASKYRTKYLRNFHSLGAANLQRKNDEPEAFIIPAGQPREETIARFIEILTAQGIEVHRMVEEAWFAEYEDKRDEFHEMPLGSFVVFVNQPQKNNILSLFERQVYPNRVNANGEAETPYDVAGWTLPIQMGIEYMPIWAVRDGQKFRSSVTKIDDINDARRVMNLNPVDKPFANLSNPLKGNSKIGLYRGFTSSMDEGWTRLVFDIHGIAYRNVSLSEMKTGIKDVDVLIIPSEGENTIMNGLSAERFPSEFVGGIGDGGVANMKKFVEDGGRLICFDASCGLIAKTFELPVKNALSGLKRNEFYNPGSIVKLDVNLSHRLADGIDEVLGAYFINSSAFEVTDRSKVRTVARYASRDALISGWMLGESYINGKSAIVEADYGKGKIIMFAFRPQHRGQSFGTFPLLFNAIDK